MRHCWLILIAISILAVMMCIPKRSASAAIAQFDIVAEFSADPTGASDSQGSIENAIEAACNYSVTGSTGSGYAKIYVPPGTYEIGSSSNAEGHLAFTTNGQSSGLGCNNVEFVGLPGARGSTVLRAGASGIGAIITDTAPHTNLAIENITFDGNGKALLDPSGPGVGLISFLGDRGVLTNLLIQDNVFENVISDTEALKLDDYSSPMPAIPAGSAIIADNEFINNQTNYGYAVNTGYGQEIFVMDRMADFRISRNYFSGNTSYSGMLGLYAYDGYGEIDHNIFNSNTATTGDMYAQQSSHIIFDHNFDVLPTNGAVAIRLVNATDILIDGDNIIGKSTSSSPGVASSGTLSVGGTWAAGTISATIQPPYPYMNPVTASYLTTATAEPTTLIGATAGLAAKINQSAAGTFLTATVPEDAQTTIALTANFAGPSGNNITYSGTGTGTISVSPTATTSATGGSEPPSYGISIYDLGAYATDSIVLSGTFGLETIGATIMYSGSPTINASYPTMSGDGLAGAASGLAAKINQACSAPCFIQPAVASGDTILLYSSTGSTAANMISLGVTSGSTITLTASSANFVGGGLFDGISPSVNSYSRDISIANTTFDSVYRGTIIAGKFGNELYSETQKAVTLNNDIAVRNGDALLFLELADPSAALSQIRVIGSTVKSGSFTNGLLSIDGPTMGTGSVTDMLVQGGACGTSSVSSPSPACISVDRSTVKLMGVDLSNLVTPVSITSPGAVTALGNLGYPSPTPSP